MFFYLFSFIIFILGVSIGSFLNVVIDRSLKGEKIIGRSYCPSCKNTLQVKDLIPLLSFFLSKGKCRYCKNQISWQYPLVELSTAILFLFVFRGINPEEFNNFFIYFLNLFLLLIITSFLIITFMTDLKKMIIFDEIIYFLIITTLFLNIISFYEKKELSIFFLPILTAIFSTLFFLFLYFITKKRGMGLGDVKIAGFMGLFLSFPKIFPAFFLAFSSGAIISLILIALKKKKLKSEIPFACFLLPATLISFFYGDEIINIYTIGGTLL